MSRPSRGDVLAELERCRGYDYVLLIFSGHGYLSSSDSTTLGLRLNQEVSVGDLTLSHLGQAMIIDCCRVRITPPVRIRRAAGELIEAGMPNLNPAACRQRYEEQLMNSGRELLVLYACSANEKAGDDGEKGGIYSSSLLQVANEWVLDQQRFHWDEYRILSVVEVHTKAVPLVQQLRPSRQTPYIQKPRSGPYPPFCVVA